MNMDTKCVCWFKPAPTLPCICIFTVFHFLPLKVKSPYAGAFGTKENVR